MRKIVLKPEDYVFIQEDDEGKGCGRINDDGLLYYIDRIKGEAIQLPKKYKGYPNCFISSLRRISGWLDHGKSYG